MVDDTNFVASLRRMRDASHNLGVADAKYESVAAGSDVREREGFVCSGCSCSCSFSDSGLDEAKIASSPHGDCPKIAVFISFFHNKFCSYVVTTFRLYVYVCMY